MTIFVVEQLTVKGDRVVCDMRVTDVRYHHTSPELLAKICKTNPDLPKHACINDEGTTFASVMEHTSVPHLLEHLVIDLQTQAMVRSLVTKTSKDIFVGISRWTDISNGRACVEVSFTDDLVALRAFRDAIQILERAMVE